MTGTTAVCQHFRDLRHKHFIHDENAFSQALPAAAINAGDKPYKVEKIIIASHHTQALDQARFDNLRRLISVALEWVTAEFDLLAAQISSDLERESYETLINLPQLTYTVPGIKDIGTKKEHL